jgi:phage FluMu gp28-like protein
MRAVADAILDKRDSVFNSINKEESHEKIRYARAIYENLEISGLPRIIIENRSEMEFDNGSRLISTANARGKPQSNFFIDEWAWKLNGKAVWTAAQPVISKGGVFRGGSSTNGADGIFWEIDTQTLQPYPDFRRSKTRWWEVQAFCTNVKEAVKTAETMTLAERVEKFAKPRLKIIFNNSIVEDFQQEYEAEFVDETTAWITWDEIRQAESAELQVFSVTCRTSQIDEAISSIDKILAAIAAGQIENVFVGGVDIGRTRNTTEIYLIGKGTTDSLPLRVLITLDACDFDSQYDVISSLLIRLPISVLTIDRNGLGRNIAEKLEKAFPGKAAGVDFTNATKALWAGNAKMLFQQNRIVLPVNRDLAYQIHSIKKKVTPSKNVVFDTETNEKHHADKFWALALAATNAIEGVDLRGVNVSTLDRPSPYASFVV